MDPIARRFMWDIVSRMTTTGRECSVILTTHSMEEAESLCNNIGIMVTLLNLTYLMFARPAEGQRKFSVVQIHREKID